MKKVDVDAYSVTFNSLFMRFALKRAGLRYVGEMTFNSLFMRFLMGVKALDSLPDTSFNSLFMRFLLEPIGDHEEG